MDIAVSNQFRAFADHAGNNQVGIFCVHLLAGADRGGDKNRGLADDGGLRGLHQFCASAAASDAGAGVASEGGAGAAIGAGVSAALGPVWLNGRPCFLATLSHAASGWRKPASAMP